MKLVGYYSYLLSGNIGVAGGEAQNTLHENFIGWMILGVVLVVLGWLFWVYYHAEVREIVRWIRYSEMWVISWFLPSDYKVMFNGSLTDWEAGFIDVPKWNKFDLKYDHLSYFTALTMQPLKYVFVTLFLLGAFWSYTRGPYTQYRKVLGLQGLIERQSKIFPIITPFAAFNPSTQPPRPPGSPVPADLPCFAEALGPEEWLAYYEVPIPDGKIDETAAAKAFQKQLGRRWKGVKGLKPHEQILLAVFCLKASRKRSEADEMLGRLAVCWSFKDGLNFKKDKSLLKEALKTLRSKDLAAKTLAHANRHAFVGTAMIGALAFARSEGGVLAPAQFVWLRGYDRTLWYPLNNLGRQSFHMEALGAMSHYKAERMTQRPIPVPKMKDAVDTIQEYMGTIKARPIPQLDYSRSKKRGVKKAR